MDSYPPFFCFAREKERFIGEMIGIVWHAHSNCDSTAGSDRFQDPSHIRIVIFVVVFVVVNW